MEKTVSRVVQEEVVVRVVVVVHPEALEQPDKVMPVVACNRRITGGVVVVEQVRLVQAEPRKPSAATEVMDSYGNLPVYTTRVVVVDLITTRQQHKLVSVVPVEVETEATVALMRQTEKCIRVREEVVVAKEGQLVPVVPASSSSSKPVTS